MNDTPEISLIVPVHNAENTLNRCVNSILMQDYMNFELLLVDDGSNDCSGFLCDELAAKDNRVHVFHKTNEGVSSARNYGIIHSMGKYITFVDSDDCLMEGALTEMMKYGSSGMVFGGVVHKSIYKDNIVEKTYIPDNHFYDFKSEFEYIEEIWLNNAFMSPWAKLFKKNIIDCHGLLFNDKFYVLEDTDFVIRYLLHLKDGIQFINKPVYCYNDDKTAELRKYRLSTEQYLYQRNCFEVNFRKLECTTGYVFNKLSNQIFGYLGSLHFRSFITQQSYADFYKEYSILNKSYAKPYIDSKKKEYFYKLVKISTALAYLVSRFVRNKF